MTPADHQKAGILFEQLCGLPDAEITAALDAACAGNVELRDQVLLLLEADRAVSDRSFLEARAIDDVARALAADGEKLPDPGTVIANYRLGSRIGAGGMGVVYEAQDLRLQRRVAVKILPPPFAGEGVELVNRFQRESRAASLLNHPNILTIFDAGFDQGHYYIATEFVEGKTLRRLTSQGPLEWKLLVDVAIQVCSALAAAHEAGIVHRDIKPENVMIRRDGIVKVLDFGLAKMERAEKDVAVSHTGAVLGTVAYMSPEQARGEEPDVRTDLFSFGAVLYEMATGQQAFSGSTNAIVYDGILNRDPLPPSQLNSALPPKMDEIVLKALEKDRELRCQSAAELGADLKRLKRDTTDSGRSTLDRIVHRSMEKKTEEHLQSITGASGREKPVGSAPSGWRVKWLAVTAALVLAALAGAYFLIMRSTHTEFPNFHRLTFRRGVIIGANFANDGKTIIYSATWDGKPYELFSTQEDSPESRPLGITNAFPISISRTGEMALILSPIVRLWETPGTLAHAPVGGGAPREVAENIFLADWSPDGSQLAVVRGSATSQALEYPMGRKLYETTGAIAAFKISPKGDLVAFAEEPLAGDVAGYVRIVDRTGRTKAVSRKWNNIQGLDWARKGAEIWFCASQQGVMTNLYAMDLRGRERTLARMPGYFFLWDVSEDGRALMMLEVSSASLFFRGASPQETDLYWHDWSTLGDISPDKSQILFSELGDAATKDLETYVRKTDGSPAVRLGEGWATAFSPDGKWAMANPKGEPPQLVAYPLHAGDPHPLTSDALRHLAGRWLPDGNRIVFVGGEPGHRPRYYVQDSVHSRPLPISNENIEFDRSADDIVISPDGSSVAAATRDSGVQLLAVEGGRASQPVTGLDSTFTPVAWCRDDSLLVYHSGEIPARIMRVKLPSGQQKPWKELAPAERTALYLIQPIRVSPDCEAYGYSAGYAPSTLFVVSGIR